MTSKIFSRSTRTNVFLAKFWFPLILLGGAFGVSGKDIYSWRFLFDCPFLIAALFGISVATLEVRGDVIRYRRFFKWTTVRHDELVDAGSVWTPFFGYLRLNRFVFPWGRVYFALDTNLNSNPFRRGEFLLLRYLDKEFIPGKLDLPSPIKVNDRQLKLRLLNFGLAGVLASILVLVVTPSTPKYQSSFENSPLIAVPQKVFQLINSFPFIMIPFACLVLFATLRYRRKDTWIAAFLAGMILARMILYLLSPGLVK